MTELDKAKSELDAKTDEMIGLQEMIVSGKSRLEELQEAEVSLSNNSSTIYSVVSFGMMLFINPFRTTTPKYLFPRGSKPLLYHQIGNINVF